MELIDKDSLIGKFPKFYYFFCYYFMKQTLRYIGLLAILPLAMVAVAPDMIGDASAAKSEGSPGSVSPKSYGSATDDVVCGDRLCSTPEGEADPANMGKAQ